MIAVIREAGLELYNDDKIKQYPQMQKVQTDVQQIIKDQQKSNRKRGKHPLAIEHDCILWHFTNDKRPLVMDSPMEAEYWIVTTDFSLIKFDKQKRRSLTTSTPICILPTNLIQMLQLWVPRTAEFEQAILSSIRPLLTDSLDYETEQTTIKILKQISRFEASDNLSEEIILKTLTNSTLRQRITPNSSDATQIELVKEALISQLNAETEQLQAEVGNRSSHIESIEEKLKSEAGERLQTQKALEEQKQEREKLASENADLRKSLDEKDRILRQQGASMDLQNNQLIQQGDRLDALEKLQENQANEKIVKSKKRGFIFYEVLIPKIIITILSIIIYNSINIFIQISPLVSGAILIGVYYWLTKRIKESGEQNEIISRWWVFTWYQKIYGFITIVIPFMTGVLQNATWDYIKNWFNIGP